MLPQLPMRAQASSTPLPRLGGAAVRWEGWGGGGGGGTACSWWRNAAQTLQMATCVPSPVYTGGQHVAQLLLARCCASFVNFVSASIPSLPYHRRMWRRGRRSCGASRGTSQVKQHTCSAHQVPTAEQGLHATAVACAPRTRQGEVSRGDPAIHFQSLISVNTIPFPVTPPQCVPHHKPCRGAHLCASAGRGAGGRRGAPLSGAGRWAA